MKVAVIIFHRHAYKYPPKWVAKCITSIQNQTYKEFSVFECDYGGEHTQLYPNSNFSSTNHLKDHAEAHNWLLDKVFSLGYDCAMNVNIDDQYSLDRFEKQIPFIENGYDVVSSNFYHIDEAGRMVNSISVASKSMEIEAARNHNIIAHPVCCYSKNFWENCTKLKSEEIPRDDFELWKRSYGKFKFIILPNFLLYYRVHSKKVSAKGQWISQ